MFNATSLIRFRASFNEFTDGTIPPEISSLISLQQLWIAGCAITGSIPSEIAELSNLTDFIAYDNALTGTVPDLTGLGRLQKLDLNTNRLTGPFPSSIGLLGELRRIILYENFLTGTLPSSIGNLGKTFDFMLANNTLTGTIPANFGSLSRMMNLDLENNSFNGNLPDYASWEFLQYFNANNNSFSGPIDSSLFSKVDLKFVYLSNNTLTGTIPLNYGQPVFLEDLWLNGNYLTGSVPDALSGDFANITELLLNDNLLSGSVPDSICSLRDEESVNYRSLFDTLHADCAPFEGTDVIRNPCDCCSDCFEGKQEETRSSWHGQGPKKIESKHR